MVSDGQKVWTDDAKTISRRLRRGIKILVLENQCKIMVPLFGAAYASPNKGTTILY